MGPPLASPSTPTRAIPANRKAGVASNSAFADLRYAIYIGPSESSRDLLTTDFSRLPVTGRHAKVSVPYGDTTLTVVTEPVGPLGGTLPARLPWIFGALGVLLTIAAALIAERLVRRRRAAERNAAEIRDLYGELGQLFGQQRTIAETLQRALLPPETPSIRGLEMAVRYVPGARGIEIGGDWYSVIGIDNDHFAFVIGDVSGRGLECRDGHGASSLPHSGIRLGGILADHNPGKVLKAAECRRGRAFRDRSRWSRRRPPARGHDCKRRAPQSARHRRR